MSERITFENARIVTSSDVIEGGLIAEGGTIQEILPKGRTPVGAIDLDGDYLMPGLVELHTDNLERQFAPRPAVRWPPDAAMLAHDQQVTAAGITTVCDRSPSAFMTASASAPNSSSVPSTHSNTPRPQVRSRLIITSICAAR